MENLPDEIKLDICSWLPAESVLQCRQVSKEWRTLLNHPCFADMHLRRTLQLDKLGTLFTHGEKINFKKQFYYGEYDENGEQIYKTIIKINYPPIAMSDHIVGSCNGLVGFFSEYGFFYICNPIIRECLQLPMHKFDLCEEKHTMLCIAYGFGYLASTNEYKVVRIFFHNHRDKKLTRYVQVYTLGKGTGWRNKGEITNLLGQLGGSGVSANGALHWMVNDIEMKIASFDLADEEFHFLPLPSYFVHDGQESFRLKVLGGLLCIVHTKCGSAIDIWSLKKKTNGSTTYVLNEQKYQSWSWQKEFSMAWENQPLCNPFDFTKSGELLLCSEYFFPCMCCRYDPKTAALKKQHTKMQFINMVRHLNTFVSLKALGEEETKKIS